LLDQTGGTDHTTTLATHVALATPHVAGITPVQGIATDGVYWYEINTNTIYKRDFTTGTSVASNTSPFTSLPAGVDHIGDGFVDGGLLYVPVVNWDGGTLTSTDQTIAVFNTSDLSLNTQFDVSAKTDFNASGLCKSHSGTIYGVSFNNSATANDAQRDIYEFNLSTGAYIATHTLPFESIGTQGIEWDGDSYFISSYDTVNVKTRLHQTESDLTQLLSIDPTGIADADEIEGVCAYGGNLYTHSINDDVRAVDTSGLYIYGWSSPRESARFLTQAQTPDEGTIVLRMTPHHFQNYRAIFDNKDTANDWEAWIYGTGEVAWRVSSAGRTGYNAGAVGVEHLYLFSWKKVGANVDIQLGIDGVIQDTATTTWVTAPSQGLWLGGGNASNTQGDHAYTDVVLYDKELSSAEWTALAADFDDIYAAAEESGGGFWLPDSRLMAPALLEPGRKPAGVQLEVDWERCDQYGLRPLYIFTGDGTTPIETGIYNAAPFTTNVIAASTSYDHLGVYNNSGNTGYLTNPANTYASALTSTPTVIMRVGVHSSLKRGIFCQGGSSSTSGGFDLWIHNGLIGVGIFPSGGSRVEHTSSKNIRDGYNRSTVGVTRNSNGEIILCFDDGTIETFAGATGDLTTAHATKFRQFLAESQSVSMAYGGLDFFYMFDGAVSQSVLTELVQDAHQFLRPKLC